MSDPGERALSMPRNKVGRRPRRICAIYTRKSSDEGLEQEFNSREACEAFIASQKHEGWIASPTPYDDRGLSGGSMERAALKQLIADIESGVIDIVVVYKVDRLTRSLADFAKLTELFDRHDASFVSVTQQFNTSTSMGRLTLNVLLSFAQFEREVAGERIRDKIAASKRRGMWMGGNPPLGYDAVDRKLVINASEAETVNHVFQRYVSLRSVAALKRELDRDGIVSKVRQLKDGRQFGGRPLSRGALYLLLRNRLYRGQIAHRGKVYDGQHLPIIDETLWEQAQKRLERNRRKRISGANTPSQSLLKGLLFDRRGNRLVPTHANKKGRRYRYYVSASLLRGEKPAQGLRIPASDLETVVSGHLNEKLRDAGWIKECFGQGLAASEIKTLISGAQQAAKRLQVSSGAALAERYQALRSMLGKVEIDETRIDVTINLPGLAKDLRQLTDLDLAQPPEPDAETIIVEAHLLRCGKQVKLILGDVNTETHHIDKRLVTAITNANTWFEMLIAGKVTGISDIAKKAHVSAPHVSRSISLAFLAPDIVEMILEGRHPITLTPDRLKRACPLPLDWSEQRALLLT